ncbi:hypothetical protein [Streptomyces sp. NPDC004685]
MCHAFAELLVKGGQANEVIPWYLLNADADSITFYFRGEFDTIRWLTDEQVHREPNELLDLHVHRFTRRLQYVRSGRNRV